MMAPRRYFGQSYPQGGHEHQRRQDFNRLRGGHRNDGFADENRRGVAKTTKTKAGFAM